MADQKLLRKAITKYGRLQRRLEESMQPEPFPDSMRGISGGYMSRVTHDALISHLLESLVLDDADDSIRLLLAYEYWRANKLEAAREEYQRIVGRGSMQAMVATRMLSQMGDAIDSA